MIMLTKIKPYLHSIGDTLPERREFFLKVKWSNIIKKTALAPAPPLIEEPEFISESLRLIDLAGGENKIQAN